MPDMWEVSPQTLAFINLYFTVFEEKVRFLLLGLVFEAKKKKKKKKIASRAVKVNGWM